MYVRAAAIFAGTRLILASSQTRTGSPDWAGIAINSLLNLFTPAWIMNSSTNVEGLKNLKFMKNKRFYVLPNALDMDDKFLQPAEVDVDLKKWINGRKIVAAVGRLCAVKNFDLFLDSAKLVHDISPDSCFLIIGEPDCREEGTIFEKRLSKRVKEENLDSFIKLTGLG